MAEIDIRMFSSSCGARQSPLPPATMAARRSTKCIGLNGATHGIGTLYWKAAHRAAWKPLARHRCVPHQESERLGLTYEEYTLEILERGRHLQIEDVERIAEIKRARAVHAVNHRK